MKVAILSFDYDPPIGGLGIVVQQEASALQKCPEVTDVTVLSPRSRHLASSSLLQILLQRGIARCPLFALLCFFKLKSALSELKPDVLIVHTGSGGAFLLRRISVPTLAIAHHTYAQEVRYVYGPFTLRHYTKRLMSLLERRTYSTISKILCVSSDTRDAVIADYQIPQEKVSVLENAIADAYFTDSLSQRVRPKTILFVGRLETRKGIDTLLRAFALAYRSDPELRLRLVGRNMLKDGLKSRLSSLGIRHAVTVLGHVHEPFRIREMQESTLVVVPSILEGFGLVAAEALALGIPVIAASSPGLRAIIDNERTGILVDPALPQGFSDAILRLIKDSGLRLRLTNDGRAEARSRWKKEKRTGELLSHLRSLSS